MNEFVQDLISTYCDEHFIDTFSHVVELVETFGIDGIEDDLTSLAMTESSMLDDTTQATIYAIVIKYMGAFLREHEIVLNDSATLNDFVDFAMVVLRLQTCDQCESIVNTIKADEDPVETFAALCGIVDTMGVGRVYNTVDSVSKALIDSVKRLYEDRIDEVPSHDWPKGYIENLRYLDQYFTEVKHVNVNSIGAFQIVFQGIKVGNKFSNYYNLIKQHLEGADVEYLVAQYVALLYLGVDSSQSILTYWKDHNQEFFEDLQLLSIVSTKIESFIVEFDRYKSEQEHKHG